MRKLTTRKQALAELKKLVHAMDRARDIAGDSLRKHGVVTNTQATFVEKWDDKAVQSFSLLEDFLGRDDDA